MAGVLDYVLTDLKPVLLGAHSPKCRERDLYTVYIVSTHVGLMLLHKQKLNNH